MQVKYSVQNVHFIQDRILILFYSGFKGIKLVIDNSHVYGYLPFPTADGTLENDLQSFAHMMMEAFSKWNFWAAKI